VDPAQVPSPTHFLSVLGAVGMTAWFGLMEEGRPKTGETLLVSGAAGAVGSLVGQLGRLAGCLTIGIAGGPEKGRRLVERYGYDAAIDHRGKDAAALAAEIRALAPGGLDLVFENVGGASLDAALLNLKDGDYAARFPEGIAAMAPLVASGQILFDEHVDHGIDNAFPAFMRLFAGTNEGKMILAL
jgi:hypothetical protein